MQKAVTLALLILAAPAFAQSEPEPGDQRPFLERWADDMMREFVDEISPELERFFDRVGPELDGMFAEIMPRLQELSDLVGGLAQYEMPELLPNGDIIMRRKSTAPPVTVDPETNAPIEL